MTESGGGDWDLALLAVLRSGALVETGRPFEPYQLVDPGGVVISPAAAYLRELQGRGLAESTQRSYSLALLRWFRFVWAVGVPWDQATRAEARDFMRWLQAAGNPARPHWRTGTLPGEGSEPGTVNAVTGRRSPGRGFAPATVLHCESVVRGFYDYHLEAGMGPMVNPFPLARAGRAHAHTLHLAAHRAVPPPLTRQAPRTGRSSLGPHAVPEAAAAASASPASSPGARRSCPVAASACVDLGDHLTWLQSNGRWEATGGANPASGNDREPGRGRGPVI